MMTDDGSTPLQERILAIPRFVGGEAVSPIVYRTHHDGVGSGYVQWLDMRIDIMRLKFRAISHN